MSRARIVVLVILAFVVFVSGFGAGRGSKVVDPELAALGEAFDRIRDLSVQLPEDAELRREAIRGMLAALEDSYAEYLPRHPDGDLDDLASRALGVDVAALGDAAGLRGYMLEPNIAYVQLELFAPGSGSLVRTEVDRLRRIGARGFVFDLRGNPGGLVDEALEVAGIFVGEQVVFRYETAIGGTGERRGVGDRLASIAVVVLVDEETASSAELVVGAIQDHGAGRVVGSKTKGKASVQRVVSLSDGSAIKLTTAVYRTPNDRDVDGEGIRPDVEPEPGPGDEALMQARQILRARAPS